jgi:predicted acetyltransferase
MLINNVKKCEAAALWKEVFHDSDEFIGLFFDNVYKPENTFVLEKEGKTVSTLFVVPYEIKIGNSILNAAYICGVATQESERGKGYIKSLTSEALNVIKNRGFDLSFLIPAETWLFDFYRKLGFTHELYHSLESFSASIVENGNSANSGDDIARSAPGDYSYFDRKQRERKCAVLHNQEDFATIIKDCEIDGGCVWTAFENNSPVGMIFAKPTDDKTVFVSEILFENETVRKKLIDYAALFFGANTIELKMPLEINNRKREISGLAYIHNDNIKDISELYVTLMLD